MKLDKKIWQWIILIIMSMIWGSSFILMKKGLESFSFGQVAAMRMFFAFIFFLPFIIARFKRLKKQYIFSLLIVGFIGNMIPAFLFTLAQTQVSSSLAGMLNAMTTFFVWIIGIMFYKSKTKPLNIIGIFIGILGSLCLIINDINHILESINYYALFIVLATFFYGINTNEVKNKLKDLDGISITAFGFMFIGPVAGVILLFQDFSPALATPDFAENLIFIIILAFFSSFVAAALFNILIKHTTAIFAASVTYLIPIVAIIWGLIDGEKISLISFAGILIVLLGVFIVNKKIE